MAIGFGIWTRVRLRQCKWVITELVTSGTQCNYVFYRPHTPDDLTASNCSCSWCFPSSISSVTSRFFVRRSVLRVKLSMIHPRIAPTPRTRFRMRHRSNSSSRSCQYYTLQIEHSNFAIEYRQKFFQMPFISVVTFEYYSDIFRYFLTNLSVKSHSHGATAAVTTYLVRVPEILTCLWQVNFVINVDNTERYYERKEVEYDGNSSVL